MRTGILGGTFNPIHYGHLRPAEEVRGALGLDEVRFVPLALPAHKSEEEIAPAEDRLEMVELAVADFPHFVCDPIEVKRGGTSYTIDTLSEMKKGSCRGRDLYFIIGADAFSLLHTWREPLGLLRLTNFAVTLRGEQTVREVLEALEKNLNQGKNHVKFNHVGENEVKVIDSECLIKFIQVTTLDISATQIRRLAHSQASLRNLLPPKVEHFIIRRGLYGRKGHVSAPR